MVWKIAYLRVGGEGDRGFEAVVVGGVPVGSNGQRQLTALWQMVKSLQRLHDGCGRRAEVGLGGQEEGVALALVLAVLCKTQRGTGVSSADQRVAVSVVGAGGR